MVLKKLGVMKNNLRIELMRLLKKEQKKTPLKGGVFCLKGNYKFPFQPTENNFNVTVQKPVMSYFDSR
jgi:hypothetical protein